MCEYTPLKSVAYIFTVMAGNYWIESWNEITDIRSYTVKKAWLKFTTYSSTYLGYFQLEGSRQFTTHKRFERFKTVLFMIGLIIITS